MGYVYDGIFIQEHPWVERLLLLETADELVIDDLMSELECRQQEVLELCVKQDWSMESLDDDYEDPILALYGKYQWMIAELDELLDSDLTEFEFAKRLGMVISSFRDKLKNQ